MRIVTCETLILGVSDYREADKIVTCFTLEQGKLTGLARGAKQSRKRFGGALEPFARLQLQLSLKEGLATLNGADIINVYPAIRQDLAKIGSAGNACELTERLTPEGEPNQRLFRLLAAYLEYLDKFPYAPSDRRFFTINLLKVTGYQPALEQCATCGADLTAASRFYQAPTGGLLCGRCGPGNRPVAAQTVALFRQALKTGRFGVLRFSAAELAEADALLDAAIAPHLNRPLKSSTFLREIGSDL
jgi:DNA repair protein RecO (recombination protein O)